MENPVAFELEDQVDNILEEPYPNFRQIKDPIHGYSEYYRPLNILSELIRPSVPISATLTRFIDTYAFSYSQIDMLINRLCSVSNFNGFVTSNSWGPHPMYGLGARILASSTL